MKKISRTRHNLILKVLEILVDEEDDSTGNSDSPTSYGREYLLDDNEQQVLYEIRKLLNRED